MHLIIDPPVFPISPLSELEAWKEELDAMAVKHADDPQALESIEFALEEVRRWIGQHESKP